MVIALYIMNMWEMPQASCEFRDCNALIFPPLYFNEFFIQNFFILVLFPFPASKKIKPLDLKWHITDQQNKHVPFCLLLCLISRYLHQHHNLDWLLTCHLAFNSCCCNVHSDQQVALSPPFQQIKTHWDSYILTLVRLILKFFLNIQWCLMMHVEGRGCLMWHPGMCVR